LGAFGSAGGLIVAAGVDGEFSEQFAGGGVDDGDVEVVDEHQDVGSCVGSADSDVVHAACDAQGDAAGFVDFVVPDSGVVLAFSAADGGGGFGQCFVAGGGCCVVW